MSNGLTNHLASAFSNENDRHEVCVKTSVDIQGVSPSTVFALITDLPRKTRLCPNTAVININHHPQGPVEVGTVFHHRVAIDGHIADYHNRVIDYAHDQYMVTESDSNPPFRIIVSVEELGTGTRLTQQESFALTELVVPVPRTSGRLGKFLRFIFGDGTVIRQGDSALAQEVEETQQRLQPRLDQWLQHIKRHLEKESRQLRA